jgi:hypothetical protein
MWATATWLARDQPGQRRQGFERTTDFTWDTYEPYPDRYEPENQMPTQPQTSPRDCEPNHIIPSTQPRVSASAESSMNAVLFFVPGYVPGR